MICPGTMRTVHLGAAIDMLPTPGNNELYNAIEAHGCGDFVAVRYLNVETGIAVKNEPSVSEVLFHKKDSV